MPTPFSKRTKPASMRLRYKLPPLVRSRILHTLADELKKKQGDVYLSMDHAAQMAIRYYGGLTIRPECSGLPLRNQALLHWNGCGDEQAIDFIEWIFRAPTYSAGQAGVDAVNEVFRQEAIGYEFSPFVERDWEKLSLGATFALSKKGNDFYYTAYPEATKKSSELMHGEVVMPALQLLAGPTWQAANSHMRKAHELFRHGDFRPAITECGAALETVLKTICHERGWAYVPDKDVLSTLVDVANKQHLYYPFYAEVLKNAGTIRNKLGAHGTEPTPTYATDAAHAEHMIHLVSSHILLLAKLAGIR